MYGLSRDNLKLKFEDYNLKEDFSLLISGKLWIQYKGLLPE